MNDANVLHAEIYIIVALIGRSVNYMYYIYYVGYLIYYIQYSLDCFIAIRLEIDFLFTSYETLVCYYS